MSKPERSTDAHNMSTEECTLWNSSKPYSDGYSYVLCTCGWKSNPVKSKDAVQLYSTHVMQAIN